MGNWRATKAKRVLAALRRIGWSLKRKARGGSHRTLERPGWQDFVFSFHDKVEIGPVMLKKIAEKTGLEPDNL